MRFKEAAPISFIGASSVCEPSMDPRVTNRLYLRVRPRFFDQTMHVSSRNIGFLNGPSFRYGNFFIPRVEKTSKN